MRLATRASSSGDGRNWFGVVEGGRFEGFKWKNPPSNDEDDDDTGTESTLYLGARWNFGARSEQTALTTPMGGFQAAGWMNPLD